MEIEKEKERGKLEAHARPRKLTLKFKDFDLCGEVIVLALRDNSTGQRRPRQKRWTAEACRHSHRDRHRVCLTE